MCLCISIVMCTREYLLEIQMPTTVLNQRKMAEKKIPVIFSNFVVVSELSHCLCSLEFLQF